MVPMYAEPAPKKNLIKRLWSSSKAIWVKKLVFRTRSKFEGLGEPPTLPRRK